MEDEEMLYLTPKDVSAKLGLGITTTRKLFKTSSFPAIKIGKQYRVSVANFRKWSKDNIRTQIIL